MPGPVFLDGETVELRTVEPEDANDLQRIVNDERVRRGLLRHEPVTGPEEEAWLESTHEDDGISLGICVDGDVVGTIGLDPPNEVWRVAEVGYLVAPDAWGNGYATDALETLCRYAFAERGLLKVTARAYETNPGSQRVLEKVGFVEEGAFRDEALVDGERTDVYRYGLLAEEFEGR